MIRKFSVTGISILAVILLTLTSLSNVVGYQSVQTSQQSIIKERISQRESLFQTIVDISNNKEIQQIILKSQMSRGIFPTSEIPVVTKKQIKQMYFLGLILSKIVNKSRMQSIIGMYQFNNQEIQREISAVIEKDATLKGEIIQLKNSECDCENDNITEWRFPVICFVLMVLFYSIYIVMGLIDLIVGGISDNMWVLVALLSYIPWFIGYSLDCRFAGFGPGTMCFE